MDMYQGDNQGAMKSALKSSWSKVELAEKSTPLMIPLQNHGDQISQLEQRTQHQQNQLQLLLHHQLPILRRYFHKIVRSSL